VDRYNERGAGAVRQARWEKEDRDERETEGGRELGKQQGTVARLYTVPAVGSADGEVRR
jgi:hypothetical protein